MDWLDGLDAVGSLLGLSMSIIDDCQIRIECRLNPGNALCVSYEITSFEFLSSLDSESLTEFRRVSYFIVTRIQYGHNLTGPAHFKLKISSMSPMYNK